MNRRIINIGILAHVDAGKTTITEQLLFNSGVIQFPGSVDKGTAQTDSLDIERQRGVSVKSSAISFSWAGKKINLIDTPGHVDFSSEAQRAFLAMDAAILVISAVEGVQAHTETIWKALEQNNIPVFFFINKIDRAGADTEAVIQQVKHEMTTNCLVMQRVEEEGNEQAFIEPLSQVESPAELPLSYVETILENDEYLMGKYLEDENFTLPELENSLVRQSKEGKLFPLLLGSAKYGTGLEELLNAITSYLPEAGNESDAELSGIVYKVEHDPNLGRLAHTRLFQGSIGIRSNIDNFTQGISSKISRVLKRNLGKLVDQEKLFAGDIALLAGMNSIRPGDILGQPEKARQDIHLHSPLFTVRISPSKVEDYSALVKAMQMLADEDPTLDLVWLREERELHIKAMGLIQLEVLEQEIQNRFDLEVNFGDPVVIYKETPAGPVEAYEEYTMPKPCWAVVRFLLEPDERGSGITYKSELGTNDIAHPYQQEIERTIPKALQQGIRGWEVTDLKISLINGEDHNVHSRAGDFAVATPMAIIKGLKNIGTVLLEPMLEYTISGPEEFLGKVISSLTRLRAELGNPQIEDEKFQLHGLMPVATTLDYAARLGALTGGKGKLSTRFAGYKEAPPEISVNRPHRGVSPLDRAKYILKARGAIR